MSAKKPDWTPYGLEAIRIAYLRRRRLVALGFAIGLALTWLMLFETTTTSNTELFVNGQRAGSSINIETPEEKKDGPVTIGIDPGRVVRADSGSAPAETPIQRASAPTFERGAPINFTGLIYVYGPFILLLLAGWLLAKKKGRHDQVNYGVYKGALPLEMVSASMSKQIFTPRMARRSLFGKRRADHLPEEVLLVERVPQEES